MMTLGHLTEDRFDQETGAIESVKIYVSYREKKGFNIFKPTIIRI